MTTLQRNIIRYAGEHGFDAYPTGEGVTIEIPYRHFPSETDGTDYRFVTNARETRLALGY